MEFLGMGLFSWDWDSFPGIGGLFLGLGVFSGNGALFLPCCCCCCLDLGIPGGIKDLSQNLCPQLGVSQSRGAGKGWCPHLEQNFTTPWTGSGLRSPLLSPPSRGTFLSPSPSSLMGNSRNAQILLISPNSRWPRFKTTCRGFP